MLRLSSVAFLQMEEPVSLVKQERARMAAELEAAAEPRHLPVDPRR
jgi:hypothetical protein